MKIYYKGKLLKLKFKDKNLSVKYNFNPNTPVVLNLNSFELKAGEELVLKDTKNVLHRNETWQTSNPTIATVNSDGVVSLLTEGNVAITCTNGFGNSDTCNLTVYAEDFADVIPYDGEEQVDCCIHAIDARDYVSASEWPARKSTVDGMENTAISNGTLTKENDYLVFDGTQSIDLSGMSYYSFGNSGSTSEFAHTFDIEFTQFAALTIDNNFTLTNTGMLRFHSIDAYQLELNKRYKITLLRRYRGSGYNFTYNNWRGRVVINDEYDSGWGFTESLGGYWLEPLRLFNNTGFIGKFYSLKSFRTGYSHWNIPYSEELEAEIIDGYLLRDYIYGTGYRLDTPVINKFDLTTEYEKADGGSPSIPFTIKSNNPPLTFKDVQDRKYSLVEFDIDGAIDFIHIDSMTTSTENAVVALDSDLPYRDYKRLGIYDNYNKTLVKCDRILNFRVNDSRIDTSVNQPASEEDMIVKYMYLSPANLKARVGEERLLRATFVPEQTSNIKVRYISSDISVATVGEYDGIVKFVGEGRCYITGISQSNTNIIFNVYVHCIPAIKAEETITIDTSRFNLVTDNDDMEVAWNNINGINEALSYYKGLGYKKIILPAGHYYVACEHITDYSAIYGAAVIPANQIKMLTDIEFDITGCTIQQIQCENSDTYVVYFTQCDNAKLTGGTIIGDRHIHIYGMRINEDATSLENGSYSSTDASPIEYDGNYGEIDENHNAYNYMRTIDFITEFNDNSPADPIPISEISSLWCCPLEKTSINTVDGGQVYWYFFDESENLIEFRRTSFNGSTSLPEGTTKLKLSFRSETREDASHFLTRRGLHGTYEFGSGIMFGNCFNCEVNGVTVKECQGDVIGFNAYPVCDTRIIDCDLSDARRQGISFVNTGENHLIKNTNIGLINGVDPQCGIDFEAYGRNEKFLFKNVNFYSNRKWDMVDCFSGEIEIDSCSFDGGIGLGQTSYNWYVHDSRFVYNTDKYINTTDNYWKRYKIHNNTVANLPIYTRGIFTYIDCENNYFDGGSEFKSNGPYIEENTSHVTNKGNTVVNGGNISVRTITEDADYMTQVVRLYTNKSKMYNCQFKSNPGNSLSIIFEDKTSEALIESDDKSNNIIQSDNHVNISGVTNSCGLVKNYTIKNLYMNGKTAGCVAFMDCDIIIDDDKQLEGSLYGGDFLFRNCNVDIPRRSWGYINTGSGQNSYNIYNFPGVRFEGCNINIRDIEETNDTAEVKLTTPYYEGSSSMLTFKDCNITCNRTVNLSSSYVDNCTLSDNIIVPTHDRVTSISMPDSMTVPINNRTQIDLVTNVNRRVRWVFPRDCEIGINSSHQILCSKAGEFVLEARSLDDDTVYDTITINVIEIPCTAISISDTQLTFTSTDTQILSVVTVPSVVTDSISFSSSDRNVATVTSAGVVTPVADGECTITVTCGSQSATCNVTVSLSSSSTVAVQSVSIPSEKTINLGKQLIFTAELTPSNATNRTVTWSINNSNCTITPNGLSCIVTGATAGSSVLTVTTSDGNHTSTCNITVQEGSDDIYLDSIILSDSTASTIVGGSVILSAVLAPSNATNKNVVWSTNNSSIVEITSDGLNATIKGLVAGTAVVTCTGEDTANGTISASCTITINERSTTYAYATAFTVPSATNIYEVPLSTYNISNNGTNANATTTGINSAIAYAKNNGYNGVKLPEGEYLIDTTVTNSKVLGQMNGNDYTYNRQGVCLLSDMELILDGCTLRQTSGTEDPMTAVVSIIGEDNVKLTGGTIIGDRDTHNYGVRINESGTEFERGGFDSNGNPIVNNDCVRSKDYITTFPSSAFTPVPLWNTIRNTVDCWVDNVWIYFYDDSNNLLNVSHSKFVTSTSNYITPPSGATKIKIMLKEENNLDACIALTTRTLWASYEFGCGVSVACANNIEINGCTVRDCTGDCIMTYPMVVGNGTNNFKIVDCTLENSRRQGISYTNIGSNYHVINCNIGYINGVDPQCGIDFEVGTSNNSERPQNIIVEGCNFYGNKKWDIVNYDGMNVEYRYNTFDATIGTTYGYNMDIHDNTFVSRENYPHPKHSYPEFMWLFKWGSSVPDDSYFKVYNNTIKGYNAGFVNTLSLSNSNNSMTNNKFIDCGDLRIETSEPNVFENCIIDYILDDGTNISGSTLTNCTIYTDNAHDITFNGSTLTDCNHIIETDTSSTVASISMPSTMVIQQGETKLLKPIILPTSAHMEGEPLTHQLWFESSDYNKVFVSEAGYVTAIGDPEGVVITCHHRDLPDGSSVNVSASCTLVTE